MKQRNGCTTFNLHQRTKVQGLFLWAGVKGVEITYVYVLVWGNLLPWWSVYELITDMFKIGMTSVTHSESTWHQSTATGGDKKEQARPTILKGSNKCEVFWHVTKWTGAPFAQNSEEDYQKLFSSYMTMLNLILWSIPSSIQSRQCIFGFLSVWTSNGGPWRFSVCRW
jgi:hypothetical protein